MSTMIDDLLHLQKGHYDEKQRYKGSAGLYFNYQIDDTDLVSTQSNGLLTCNSCNQMLYLK